MYEKFCEICGAERSGAEVYISYDEKEVCFSCWDKHLDELVLRYNKEQEQRRKAHTVLLANEKRSKGGRE